MSQTAKSLNVSQSIEYPVDAKEKWNPQQAQILFERGKTYQIEIVDVIQWDDNGIREIDPIEGFDRWYLSLFRFVRRYRVAPLFMLIGAIGKNSKHFFPISQSPLKYTATETGDFFCFANDAPFAYGNNKGRLTLKVTRLA
ncbi:MAG: hypothetical protein AAF959_17650 [Cyanobacteria bacterium P01_D01_bin.56]